MFHSFYLTLTAVLASQAIVKEISAVSYTHLDVYKRQDFTYALYYSIIDKS